MERTAIFIDGAYLEKILKSEFSQVQVDFQKMIHDLCRDEKILRAYYYNALPYQSNPPTEEEKVRVSKSQGFLDVIRRRDYFEVREGRTEKRGVDDNGNPMFEQKMVDILLVCDLLRLSIAGQITKAIVIAGDSDFVPAFEIAKDNGVHVELICSQDRSKTHRNLYNCADIRKNIDADMISRWRKEK